MLMAEMLDEIAGGTWRVTRVGFLRQDRKIPAFLPDVWITGMNDPLGQAACAIGFACLDHRFSGLNLDNMVPVTMAPSRFQGHPRRFARGWEAVSFYFGLDEFTARNLFGPEGRPAYPAMVSEWIRDLLLGTTSIDDLHRSATG